MLLILLIGYLGCSPRPNEATTINTMYKIDTLYISKVVLMERAAKGAKYTWFRVNNKDYYHPEYKYINEPFILNGKLYMPFEYKMEYFIRTGENIYQKTTQRETISF